MRNITGNNARRRRLFLPTLLLLSFVLSHCSSGRNFQNRESRGLIEVTVNNVRPKGKVYVALYDGKESFEAKSNPAAAAFREPTNGRARFVFSGDLVPGRYALAVFQDDNENQTLDTYPGGLPREGFGFSQITSLKRGEPGWDLVSFVVDRERVSVDVQLMRADD